MYFIYIYIYISVRPNIPADMPQHKAAQSGQPTHKLLRPGSNSSTLDFCVRKIAQVK